MNYHDITTDDMLNGDGLRVVLWVSGCTHHCEGCQNPITWDITGGLPFDKNAEDELFEKLNKNHISGITFSGGDPLHPMNRDEVLRLIKKVHNEQSGRFCFDYCPCLSPYRCEKADPPPQQQSFATLSHATTKREK